MKTKQKQLQNQQQNVKQNVKVVIGENYKPRQRRRVYPKSKSQQGNYQSMPTIITNITNPSAVPTNYQLPIYNQVANQPKSPFISNTPPLVNVAMPLGIPNKDNEIPVINKKVEVDPTPLSGAVPASFIPQEAPQLIKAGGAIELYQDREFVKDARNQAMKIGANQYLPSVEGEFITPVEAVAVKPRKPYEYKPETLERRQKQKEERQQQQNVNPLSATVEPAFISPLETEPNKTILQTLSNEADIAQQGQKEIINLMMKQEGKKKKELSMTPSAIYQRERRERLKNNPK
jgi:hypothetical protein